MQGPHENKAMASGAGVTRLRMLITKKGSIDGVSSRPYIRGRIYDLDEGAISRMFRPGEFERVGENAKADSVAPQPEVEVRTRRKGRR